MSFAIIFSGDIYLGFGLKNKLLKFNLNIGNSNTKFPNKNWKFIIIDSNPTAIYFFVKICNVDSEI